MTRNENDQFPAMGLYLKCEYSFGLFCWYQKANQFLPSNQTPREKIETVDICSVRRPLILGYSKIF